MLKEEAEKAGGTSKIRRTLVFVNTKRMSDMAALYLSDRQIPANSINGDRGQHLREKALQQFRDHKVSVLVATDVCARGIDVKHLDHVGLKQVNSFYLTLLMFRSSTWICPITLLPMFIALVVLAELLKDFLQALLKVPILY